jgi:glycosyltransferase involved in cell wall biosynthesis
MDTPEQAIDKQFRVVLVIPAYNESQVLPGTLASLPAGLFDEVVVADNGSTDGTAGAARRAGARVVQIPQKGYGRACRAAIDALNPETDIAVFLQADGSEDAAEASSLLACLLDEGADLALGSRVLGRAEPGALSPHQRFGNWLATRLIRLLYGHPYTDLGPFRAARVATLRRLDTRHPTYGWTLEMQVRALELGLRVQEVPVSYRKRAAGEPKVAGTLRGSLGAAHGILTTLFRLWWTRGRRGAA